MRNDKSWLTRAACAGRDPTWWSENKDAMPAAVRVCLECPVRQPCLEDALKTRDNGVIRAGMMLTRSSRGYSVTPLICQACNVRPVQVAKSGVARYCGRTCRVASSLEQAGSPTRARVQRAA